MGVIAGGQVIGSAPHYRFADAGGDSPKGLIVEQEVLSGTQAFRQGALSLEIERGSGEADSSWDGNPDTGFKLRATNRATGNSVGEGGIRGLDVLARNRGTNINYCHGGNVSVRNDSGGTAASMAAMTLTAENYGNVADSIVGLDIVLLDENDGGVHTKHGILVRNTDQSAQSAADSALKVSHTSTNGFDAMLEAATAIGDGVVASVATPGGNTTHALLVKIAGTVAYIPVYAAVGF
ncbi:hypothetical protein LCGC14_1693750 [marine sediment metagenome]|uniref:Uncharacterized protein n=1 Tax=marine sediment metagenome TaxID=412755 RepID=A0A0F9HKL1_9ZZZZ